MLAQNFKTAEALHIPEDWWGALIKTLHLLDAGQLRHASSQSKIDFSPAYSGLFNMSGWSRASECGTVCCIGGTAELIGGVRMSFYKRPRELHNLFYPPEKYDWSAITVAQAAIALRSYLTTGDARWDLALAE